MKFHEWKSIEQVIYRYVEIALIILGIVLMYSSMNDTFWRGIGLHPS
jgi:glucose uptake protein GlcU